MLIPLTPRYVLDKSDFSLCIKSSEVKDARTCVERKPSPEGID